MKITLLIVISFFTATTAVFCQTKSLFIKPSEHIPKNLFEFKANSTTTATIYRFGTITLNNLPNAYNTNLLPQAYNWTADLRKAESIENMLREIPLQDNCGRDLPINIHQEVIQRVYFRTNDY